MPENNEVDVPTNEQASQDLSFEDALQRACLLAEGERERGKEILRDAVGFTKGQSAQLIDALADALKMDKRTLGLMLHDERCRLGGVVLTRASEIAAWWVARTLEGMPGGDLVYSLGKHWQYDDTPDAVPCFRPLNETEVERALEVDMPVHPLVQSATGRREIMKYVRQLIYKPEIFFKFEAGFPMLDCVVSVDPSTGDIQIRPHSPEIRNRYVLPVTYDPTADCPVFKAGLERIMPDAASRGSFQEMAAFGCAGARLSGDNACSVTIVVGPPNSGKSSIAMLLELFIPEEERAALQPADMTDKFMSVKLQGVRMNVVKELDVGRPLGGARFKAIASREAFDTRPIRGGAITVVPTAAHVYMSNEPPRLDDKTGAFSRRIRAFRLPRALSRDETDPDYREKIAAELPGITNWLLEGWVRATKRGYFAEAPEHAELIAEMRNDQDAVANFVSRFVMRCDRSARPVTNQQIFERVRAHALTMGVSLEDVPNNILGRRVADALRRLLGVELEPTKTQGMPYYKGIRLLPGLNPPAALETI